MDHNNYSKIAKTIKEKTTSFIKSYLETYLGDLPQTKKEFAEKLPLYLLMLGKCITFIIIGRLFGGKTFFYSALPFGTALLCAAKKNVSFIYIGLLISAVNETTGQALPLFLIYTALYIGRILVCRATEQESASDCPPFSECLKHRIVEGMSASILISFYRAAYFGFLYYDLIGGLFEIAVVPLLIFLYDLAFDESKSESVLREIGLLSLMASAVICVSDIYVFGFSLSVIGAIIISLHVSRQAGALRGGIYGLVCGFISNTALSPVFAISGLSAGLLWHTGSASAVTISCILSILCGLYIEGFNSLIGFAPEVLLCSILFLPLCKAKLLPPLKISGEYAFADREENALILAERKQKEAELHIQSLSKAFSELSEVFYTLSDRSLRPKLIDTQEMCDKACDIYCTKCLFKKQCWDKEYSSTRNVFSQLSRTLCEKGYATVDDVEPYMVERCMHLERMIERINDEHGRMLESMIKENKTEIFAMDYDAMARLLETAVKINCEDCSPHEELQKKLREACKKMRFRARNICVYGKRKLSVIAGGVDIASTKMSAGEMKKCFENICETKLSEPRYDVEGDYITLTMHSEKCFVAEYAAVSNTKKNEKMCGDTVCMFENPNGYFYSLISDGMGSGKEAAVTSRLCGIFLKKMLMARNAKPIALEMLNNFIRSKNTECFSTVDLLEIDMLNGNASFIKSGAAASYVFREDRLFRIASNTMPVGITREINAEEVKFALQEGDIIVMASDGAGQSVEDLLRVNDVIERQGEYDLQVLAQKILESAVKQNDESDDITVGVIRVKRAE